MGLLGCNFYEFYVHARGLKNEEISLTRMFKDLPIIKQDINDSQGDLQILHGTLHMHKNGTNIGLGVDLKSGNNKIPKYLIRSNSVYVDLFLYCGA